MGLKDYLTGMPEEHFETLKFEDLEVGDKYISFPMPGDNSGHGGYLGTHYVFEKIESKAPTPTKNSRRCRDGMYSFMPEGALVIKVK